MDTRETLLVRWSKFFITRYRVSILILLAIVLAGLWGVQNNQRQDFPIVPINFVFVGATYPGASPADIEQEVLLPIEQAVAGFDGVNNLRSNAQNSFGSIQISVESVSQTDDVAAKVTEELGKIGLPDGAEASVQTFDAMGPSLALGLVGSNGENTSDLLKQASEIKSRLETVSKEIKKIEVIPENEYELTISLDAKKLAQNRLSFDLVKSNIQSQIISLPGGSLETDDGRTKTITINAPVDSLEDINNISFGSVVLSDIAEITRVPKNSDTIHYVGYLKDGEPFAKESVYFMVYKKDDGDVIRISESIREEIENINSSGLLPENMELVVGYDSSPYVDAQLESLLNNGYLGLALILIVLLFFINLRTAIVVALIIPLVILISLFVLNVIGYTLNILTLFAMILTLGILVDNAIVIAEGMMHELEKGATKKQAAITSIKKLGPAVTAATLTTVVVFIPFANIGGIMGDFLKYIPYTIIIILLSSYFVAVSITPLLGRFFLKEETYEERRESKLKSWQKMLILPAIVHYGQNIVDNLANGYANMMQKIFNKRSSKILVLTGTLILLVGSFAIFAPQLDFEQFPTQDGNIIQVDFEFPVGTPAESKKDLFLKTQDDLIMLPYFETFYTFGDTIFATFVEPVDRPDQMTIFEIVDQYEVQLDVIRENIPEGTKIQSAAAGYGPPASEYDITVELLDSNQETLASASTELVAFIEKQDSVVEVVNGPIESLVPSIEVDLDKDRLSSQGVNALVASGAINGFFAPQKIGSLVVRDDGISDDVIINFSRDSTDSIDDLKTLTVPSTTRGLVPLETVASVEEVKKPISIARLNSRRVAKISIILEEGADALTLNNSITDFLSDEKLEEMGLQDDALNFGGEFAEFEGDFSNLQIVFLLSMIAVYLILVYQFHSYFQPALIMFAVPLALIGVFPGLLLVGSSLNMISGLGIVALVGIVVNDAIVLIATYNRYREEYQGESTTQTLVRTGRSRFKPIFSTSITTIGGILPLTLYDPFWTGLGTSIIAGLIFSTIGTLVAIPILYSISISLGDKLKKLIQRKKQQEV